VESRHSTSLCDSDLQIQTKAQRQLISSPWNVSISISQLRKPISTLILHTQSFHITLGGVANVIKEPGKIIGHQSRDDSVILSEQTHQMMNIVQADPCSRVRSAYNCVVSTTTDDIPPSSFFVFCRLRRKRSDCFPAIPRSINEVLIAGEWAHMHVERWEIAVAVR
jgi:hypothetical protein